MYSISSITKINIYKNLLKIFNRRSIIKEMRWNYVGDLQDEFKDFDSDEEHEILNLNDF